MMTFNNSSQNRLLALDQALLGWKRSRRVSSDDSPPIQNEQTQQTGDGLPEPEDVWDNEAIAEESSRANYSTEFDPWFPADDDEDDLEDGDEDEWMMDRLAEVPFSSVHSPDTLSYKALAYRLESNASQRFRDKATRLQTQWKGGEDDMLSEPPFFSTSHSVSTPSTPQPTVSQVSKTSQTNWYVPMPESSGFSLPEIDLPEAALSDPAFAPSAAFSDGDPSYTSLFQVIQFARQGDLTTESDDGMVSTAQNAQTIDVKAEAIAESQDEWDEPLYDLPDPYTV